MFIKMEGSLDFDSEAGKGTTFTIAFPISIVQNTNMTNLPDVTIL